MTKKNHLCVLLVDKLTDEAGVKIIKDGACHTLITECCKNEDTAVYRFESEGRKSEAKVNVQGQNKIHNLDKYFKTQRFSILFFIFFISMTLQIHQQSTQMF